MVRKINLPSQSAWSLELGYSVVLEPGVLHHLRGAHSLLGVLDKQAGDETLGLLRDVIPVTRWEVKVTILYKNSMDAELFYFRDIYIP